MSKDAAHIGLVFALTDVFSLIHVEISEAIRVEGLSYTQLPCLLQVSLCTITTNTTTE